MDSSIGGQMTSNIRLNYEKVMREAARLDGEENVFEAVSYTHLTLPTNSRV